MKPSRLFVSLLGALLLVGLVVFPAAAVDDGYPQPDDDGYPLPDDKDEEEPPVVDDDVEVEDEVTDRDDEVVDRDEVIDVEEDDEVSALAFSGSNTTPLVLGGLVLTMLGGLLLILARRRTAVR